MLGYLWQREGMAPVTELGLNSVNLHMFRGLGVKMRTCQFQCCWHWRRLLAQGGVRPAFQGSPTLINLTVTSLNFL